MTDTRRGSFDKSPVSDTHVCRKECRKGPVLTSPWSQERPRRMSDGPVAAVVDNEDFSCVVQARHTQVCTQFLSAKTMSGAWSLEWARCPPSRAETTRLPSFVHGQWPQRSITKTFLVLYRHAPRKSAHNSYQRSSSVRHGA